MYIFFFQAEDGIRDYKVTGVQTCALPIFTLAVTILVSAFVSLTLTPMMCAKLLRHQKKEEEGWFYRKSEEAFNSVIALDRKSTRLNSSHLVISYAVFCLTNRMFRITHSLL